MPPSYILPRIISLIPVTGFTAEVARDGKEPWVGTVVGVALVEQAADAGTTPGGDGGAPFARNISTALRLVLIDPDGTLHLAARAERCTVSREAPRA